MGVESQLTLCYVAVCAMKGLVACLNNALCSDRMDVKQIFLSFPQLTFLACIVSAYLQLQIILMTVSALHQS